jgi:hypothetical protein
MGWAMHKLLPDRTFTLLGTSFSLNPGPFNKKEHLLISVLAGSGSNASYAGEILTVQDLFYKRVRFSSVVNFVTISEMAT